MSKRPLIAWTVTLLLALVILPSAAEAQRRGGRGGGLGGALRNAVGAPSVTETQLVPSQLNASFAAYDEENPLVDAGVTATAFGISNYDSFFSDVATVEGTLAVAQHTVERANNLLDGGLVDQVFSGSLFTDALGTAVDIPAESRQGLVMSLITGNFSGATASGAGMTQEQFNTVQTSFYDAYPDTVILRETLPASVEAIAALPATVANLSSTAPTLVTEAPNAFAGAQAMNLPRVTTELADAGRSIANMPGDIVNIGEALTNLLRSNQ